MNRLEQKMYARAIALENQQTKKMKIKQNILLLMIVSAVVVLGITLI